LPPAGHEAAHDIEEVSRTLHTLPQSFDRFKVCLAKGLLGIDADATWSDSKYMDSIATVMRQKLSAKAQANVATFRDIFSCINNERNHADMVYSKVDKMYRDIVGYVDQLSQ
jgi:hypothetical protein